MNIKIEPGANVQITDKPIVNVYGDVVQHKEVHIHPEKKGQECKETDSEEVNGGPVPITKEQPARPKTASVAQETFADRVKAIICKAATRNGEHIETKAKGHPGAYVFNIDAEAFCRAMDELVSVHGGRLEAFLGGSMACVQVTKVCFFIGHVIRMHVINDSNLQTTDIVFAFEEYYSTGTVKSKLGDKKTDNDKRLLMGIFDGLLKKYKV